jgi:prephenate dehydrogenase
MRAFPGGVLVVGAGLLGTSIALALRGHGVEVALSDVSEENLRIAHAVGAASAETLDTPSLVVVAVPPDHLAGCIATALRHPGAVVTDVGSVKSAPLAQVRERVAPELLSRYVGGHPMAGSERSGPFAASAALFDGRPWAVTPHPTASPDAVAAVRELVGLCGATAITFTPGEHDQAVARTSHLPHLLASLVAGRLVDSPGEHLALSGQGVRDVTRVAAGDPGLWEQIVAANAAPLAALLTEVRADVDTLLAALDGEDRGAVGRLLGRGVAGTAAIPGKHGGPARPEATVYVAVPDHPGELARLFGDAGEIGVNIEDVRIDHDPGRPVGLVELYVAEPAADQLLGALAERGWTTHR